MRLPLLWALIGLLTLATPGRAAKAVFTLSLPNCSWAVNFSLGDSCHIESHVFNPVTGQRHLHITLRTAPVDVYVGIDPAAGISDPARLRDNGLTATRDSLSNLTDVSAYERPGAAYFEYTIDSDKPAERRHAAAAYRTRGDTAISVTVVKAEYRYEDDTLLYSILNCFEIDTAFTPSVNDVIIWADYAFLNKQWKEAIAWYEGALAADRQHRVLGDADWIATMENLGRAYSEIDDFDNAEQVLREGLLYDDDNALLLYSLAGTFAEKKQLDSTLVYLEQAFKNEWKLPTGRYLPEPSEDSRFDRFKRDLQYRALLHKYGRRA